MYSDLAEYYLRWYHERPVAISSARREELHRLHGVLMKCVNHFVQNYSTLVPKYMPLSDKEMDILDMQSGYPFRAGTFRPDYLISSDGRILLCEITSRFFAHGIFMSWFGTHYADAFTSTLGARPSASCSRNRCHPRHRKREGPACGRGREATFREQKPDGLAQPGVVPATAYEEMMDYMASIAGGAKRMYVFKSADKSGEIRLYKRFYESLGMTVTIVEAPEVESRRSEWDRPGTFLVSALNQNDILGYSLETLRAMMNHGMYSDFRNIFLIHDKRFMHLWFQDEFTSSCLNREETEFLRAHAIPTYLTPPSGARQNKDAYILKPWRLGKSESVFAGPLCSELQWQELFDSGKVDSMICQPFISQRTFPTVWEGQNFDDYMCGMMLCVDDKLFDSGQFRCSSLPVTNVGDDRKAAVLYTDDPAILQYCDIL